MVLETMPVLIFLISTLLPGTTSPLGSTILPASDPLNSCADAVRAARIRSKPAQKTRPFGCAVIIVRTPTVYDGSKSIGMTSKRCGWSMAYPDYETQEPGKFTLETTETHSLVVYSRNRQ